MSHTRKTNIRTFAVTTAMTLVLATFGLPHNNAHAISLGMPQAYAAESGHSGGQGSGGQGSGGQGSGGQGYHGGSATHGNSSGSHGGSSGEAGSAESSSGHQGGPSDTSTGKGPQYHGGSDSSQSGGRPAWSKDTLPADVELGRLNVARAPAHVLDKAVTEAINNFDTKTATEATLYSKTAEAFAAYVETNYSTVTRIDSPLENLGLMRDLLTSGKTQLPGVKPASTLDLAAILLGSAADKEEPITNDTVIALSIILGLPEMTDAQITSLADKADTVRLAILAGHGE